ncbi:uncharacterized protein CG42266 isoform X2 [Drosophila eugracilis]|uniref:uncharacterized protein CG42266 isoform X2 n=1 Tax=Drosophila eugracilis TaxID=29029 RepID=UPI001BDB6A50|nr:uncharacterized protein CG42266 isoform X2 [Drosophila eugracilis]
MFCEQPTPEPEKNICRCKNCVLRHSDILPWPEPLGLMAERDGDKEGNTSRRVSNRTIQSVDSDMYLRDGNERQPDNYKTQSSNRNEVFSNYTPRQGGLSPILHGATSPIFNKSHSQTRLTTQQPAQPPQPTILLIVVNKNDPPPFQGNGYPGASPGYQGHGHGGYQGQGYMGYQGPGPRGYPGPRGGPPGNYYPPSRPDYGAGTSGRPRLNYDPNHVRYNSRRYSDGVRNSRNRYQDEWRAQSRRNSNNVYADQSRIPRQPEPQRNCRCPAPEMFQNKSPITPQNTDDIIPEHLNEHTTKKSRQRLIGRGCNCRGSSPMENDLRPPRTEFGNSGIDRNKDINAHPNNMEYFSKIKSPDMQEVIVTDAKNKTYKCIQVPICISTGKLDTCRCCKCASASEPEKEESFAEEAECTCNRQGKCTCVPNKAFPENLGCECDLTNLEQTLRDLIPNTDCICYLKKKRRRKHA